MKRFSFGVVLILVVKLLFATPVESIPIKVTQPNGDSITIVQYGDEYGMWYETLDGYVIEKDSLNNWVYVKTDNDNNLVLTNQIVNNISIPSGIDLNSIYTAIDNRRQLIYNSLNDDLLLSPNLEDEETAQAVQQGATLNISQAKAPAKKAANKPTKAPIVFNTLRSCTCFFASFITSLSFTFLPVFLAILSAFLAIDSSIKSPPSASSKIKRPAKAKPPTKVAATSFIASPFREIGFSSFFVCTEDFLELVCLKYIGLLAEIA